MARNLRTIGIIFVLAFAAMSTAPALAQNFKATGIVTLEDGTPVKSASLIAEPLTEGRRVQKAKTKKDGTFLLPFLEFGEYRYRVEAEDLLMRSMKVKVSTLAKQVNLEDAYDIGPDQSTKAVAALPSNTVEMVIVMVPKSYFAGALTIPGDAKASASLEEASALIQEGRLDEAAAKLDAIIAQHADSAAPLYMKGLVLSRQQKPREAIDFYRRAYGVDPSLPGVAAQIGTALFESGAAEEAVEWFEKEQANSPDAVPVALNLAVVLTSIGEPMRDRAIKAWERVIQLAPSEAGAYVELANIYTEMGDEDKAAEYLRKMEEVGQPNAAAWFNIGANFANKDALDKAELAYKKALEIDPTLALAHREMGYLFARKGDLTTALDHFKTYVALAPEAKDSGSVKEMIEMIEKKK